MTETKHVGIWIRVSTEDQARGESPETHEKRARMYAEVKGWEVATVYHLEGVSGKAVMEHPEAKRMLADIHAGRIKALIFSKLARLARDTKNLLEIAEDFREAGADLISLGESIDTSTPAGRLFYTVIAAMAQWEREEISERVKASVKVRAAQGKPLGGQPPFGYKRENKQLVLDETEAPILRELFEIFLRERRLKTTARLLNEAGYRTRRGLQWSAPGVRNILTNPSVKGRHRLNYTESTGTSWRLKPKEEWRYTEIPAAVPPHIFDEANALIDERRLGKRAPGRKSRHLFSGLVHCRCGGKMYVPTSSGKYTCKKCRDKIPAEALQTVFLNRLREFLSSPEETGDYLARASERLEAKRSLLLSLRREVSEVESEMRDLFTLYRGGGLSVESFRKRNTPLEDRLVALGDEIPRVEGEIAFLEVEELGSSDLVNQADLIVDGFEDIPLDDQRIIVEHILSRIEASEGTISFTLAGRPPTTPDDGDDGTGGAQGGGGGGGAATPRKSRTTPPSTPSSPKSRQQGKETPQEVLGFGDELEMVVVGEHGGPDAGDGVLLLGAGEDAVEELFELGIGAEQVLALEGAAGDLDEGAVSGRMKSWG